MSVSQKLSGSDWAILRERSLNVEFAQVRRSLFFHHEKHATENRCLFSIHISPLQNQLQCCNQVGVITRHGFGRLSKCSMNSMHLVHCHNVAHDRGLHNIGEKWKISNTAARRRATTSACNMNCNETHQLRLGLWYYFDDYYLNCAYGKQFQWAAFEQKKEMRMHWVGDAIQWFVIFHTIFEHVTFGLEWVVCSFLFIVFAVVINSREFTRTFERPCGTGRVPFPSTGMYVILWYLFFVIFGRVLWLSVTFVASVIAYYCVHCVFCFSFCRSAALWNMCHELAHVKSSLDAIRCIVFDVQRMKLSKLLRAKRKLQATDVMHQWRFEFNLWLFMKRLNDSFVSSSFCNSS